MTFRIRPTSILVLAGAILLLVTQFNLALSGAGSYKSLASVKLGLVFGIGLAYLVALWLALALSARAKTIQSQARRNSVLFALALTAGLATFLAPLLPSGALAVICLSQSLCPESANPILWGYLQLVTALPTLPFLVGFVLVFLSAIPPRRLWGSV